MDRRAGNGKSAVETDFVKFVTKSVPKKPAGNHPSGKPA
jgi:hypothetical protein